MLPRRNRIVRQTEWQRLHRWGAAVSSLELVLRTGRNHLSVTRFGFLVGTKVDKKATRRNLIKRQLRAIIVAEMARLKSGRDVILVAKPAIKKVNYHTMRTVVMSLLQRARLLT